MTKNERILTAGITIIVTMWVIAYLFSKEINKNNAQTIYELRGENNQLKKQIQVGSVEFAQSIAKGDSLERELSTFREQLASNEQLFNKKLHDKIRHTMGASDSAAIEQFAGFLAAERDSVN